MRSIRRTAIALVTTLIAAGTAVAQAAPGQPSSGPEGSNHPHASYTVTDNGSGRLAYWVYQPASPKPASAPLIIFNPGANVLDPSTYNSAEHRRRGAWSDGTPVTPLLISDSKP